MALERNLASIWEAVADRVGDAPAVVQGSLRRSWTDFDDRAARLASAFADVGVGPGSKVAQYLYNSAEYMESFYAAMKLRAIPVNVNYRYLDEELLYLLENSESEVLLFHSSLADRVERVADRAKSVKLFVEVSEGNDGLSAVGSSYDALIAGHELAPRITRQEDDVLMTYTGGTTGMPKGVMSRVKGAVDTYLASVPVVLGMAPLSEPEEIITTAGQLFDEGRQYASMPACPLMHGTGMGIGALPATTFGGRLVLLEGRGLDVDELWSTVERESVNAITIVGDAFARPLLRALDEGPKRDLTSVNLLLSAGSMFSAEIKGGLLEHLETCMIIDYIAATEGAMGISISTKGNPAPTGRFIPNPGVKVLTEDGREVAAGSGETGMVAIGGSIPDGYFHDDEKTAKTFKEFDGVRYSIPGDWATVEPDGMITLLGRGSQCINTGGEKVFPEEVEEVLKRHAAVEDALVFGIPDERFGQRVVAVASLSPGAAAEADAIVEGVRDHLSSFKLPRQVVVVDEVPRAPNGKADYPRARELFENSSIPRQ